MNHILAPVEILKTSFKDAIQKRKLNNVTLYLKSVLGGAYIALGALLAIYVAAGLKEMAQTNPGLEKLILGALFPIGLFLVVILKAELFTANTALLIPALLTKRIRILSVFRNWIVTFFGNFVGAVLVAFFLAYLTELFEPDSLGNKLRVFTESKCRPPFRVMFFKGLGCGWLLCLGIWMARATPRFFGKLFVLWFTGMTFMTLGFEHSISNLFYIPAGIMYDAKISVVAMFTINILPVALGNIAGGSFFVGLLYWWSERQGV